MSVVENFDILSPVSFLEATGQLAKSAQGRVGFEAMIWYPDAPTYQVIRMLEEAAGRGIRSEAKIDEYTLMTTDFHNNLWPAPSARKARQRQTQAMIQRMREVGVQVDLLNPPNLLQRLIPQLRRNHRKIALIDHIGFVMGFNLTRDNFRWEDVAVALTDAKVVESLAAVFADAGKKEKHDQEISCSGDTSLLVDCGKVGQSLILERAADMVKRARYQVRYINLFHPNGVLEREMIKAVKRGVEVEGIISNPRWFTKARWDFRMMQLLNMARSKALGYQLVLGYHNPNIHAKVLVVDNQALVGSHNFVWEGVLAGTKELDIFSTHPTLVGNLTRYYQGLKENSQGLTVMGYGCKIHDIL